MKDTNRQVLPSGLWVVATPIGNLSDLSPRARMALENANFILCEDTRRTSVLFSALEIASKDLERLDAHTPLHKMDQWVQRLKEGESAALVTDAGTPAVSDPGALFVARLCQENVKMTPIPGPSAVATLLSVCGFQETAFTFRGFFPRKSSEQNEELNQAFASDRARVYVWFESPLRIVSALEVLSETFPKVQACVGKELTKIHERLFHGSASEVYHQVANEIKEEGSVGEWCFAIQFPKKEREDLAEGANAHSDVAWIKALRCLIGAQVSVSEASKAVCQEFGIPKRLVYTVALQILEKK